MEERRRAGDLSRVTHRGRDLPDARRVHERLWKKLESGVSVWIVKGRLVRSAFDADFTEGGHDRVYHFVPKNEVWLDDDLGPGDGPVMADPHLFESQPPQDFFSRPDPAQPLPVEPLLAECGHADRHVLQPLLSAL